MTTTGRHRTAVAAVVAALVGGVVGVGGTSLALWRDSAELNGSVAAGYQHFAVGSPGATVPAPSGTARFTVGRAAAETLVRDGEVAVAIQVDSLSQGNTGLRYALTPPASWGEGVLGTADASVFRVAAAAECSTDRLSPDTVPSEESYSSTPVPATYTSGTDPVREYWCVYAAYDGPPTLGEYENRATVAAKSPTGQQVQDHDDWDATVVTDLDPADEADHHIDFTSETFRPGEEP